MNSRYNLLVQALRKKIGLLAGISIGIFLFILFFQPFTLDRFDFNDRLLFIAGFGGIVFVIMLSVISVLLWAFRNNTQNNNEPASVSFPGSLIILALSSVAFAFYLRYVGSVSISFYIMSKVVLICLAPPVILQIFEGYKNLMKQNKSLITERKLIQRQIEKFEEDNLNKTVEFISETGSENLKLRISEIIFIQSADNYVEVVFLEGETVKKKLIRNTLRNIELQIKQYSNFIRCHRTCIVNMHYIEKLNQDYSSHWITLKVSDEKIPVSRQYLLKLKEAL